MSKPDSKELEALLKLPENRYCADCKTPGPRWASVNLGIFVCINCSGIHRAMGVHISQVRSVTLDTWTREQYDTAKSIGNEKANEYWEAKLPSGFKRPNSSDMFSLEKFIRDKYERKLYIQKKKKNRPKKKIHTRKSPSKVSDSKKSQKPKKKIVLKKPVSNQETNDKIQNQKETLVNFKDNSQERSNSTQPNNTFNLMNEFTDLSMNHAQRRSEPNISQLKSQQNSMQNNADSLILLEPTQPTFGVNQQNNQKKNLILSMFDSPNKFPTTQPIMNQQSANRVTRSKKKNQSKSKTKTKKNLNQGIGFGNGNIGFQNSGFNSGFGNSNQGFNSGFGFNNSFGNQSNNFGGNFGGNSGFNSGFNSGYNTSFANNNSNFTSNNTSAFDDIAFGNNSFGNNMVNSSNYFNNSNKTKNSDLLL